MSKFLLALYKAVHRMYFDSKKCNFIPATSVVHGYIVFEPSAYMNTLQWSVSANFRQTAKGIHGKR
jgi:hypothetical protein